MRERKSLSLPSSVRMDPAPAPRWSLALPLIAGGLAILLSGLAALAMYAFDERADLALQGKILGVAHTIESELRDAQASSPERLLEEIRSANSPPIASIILRDASNTTIAEVGTRIPGGEIRKIEIFPGPPAGPPDRLESHGQGRRGRRGRKGLEISLVPGAGRPPLRIRLLFPLTVLMGLGLVVLARISGRSFERRYGASIREAQAQHFEALGRAGAGLAHQLRNPLATIKGNCQLMGESLADPKLLKRCHQAIQQAQRMENMLETLLDYARPPSPEITEFPVSELFQEFESMYPELQGTADASILIRADREHLRQVLEVLISNAFAHSPEGEPVELSSMLEGEWTVLQVSDRGPGPGEHPEDLFEPYVTTRPDGSGLGLSIARSLVEANGGSIELVHREAGGAEARVRLPGRAG